MDFIVKLSNIVESAKQNGGICEKEVPANISEINRNINTLLQNVDILDNKIMYKDITAEHAWILVSYAIDMASYAIRLSKHEFFVNGIKALKIAYKILDKREILIILPLYYDLSCKNKWTFDFIENENDNFFEFVKLFLSREEEDKTLECMGFVLEEDCEGNLTYIRTW